MLAVACCAKLSTGKPFAKISTTSGGVPFGIIGEKPASPAPTVFFFGKGIEETLAWPGFDDALVTLGSAVVKVAVDAPCHGFEQRSGEPLSLSCWRYRLELGSDIADLVHRARAVLDFLAREHYSDPGKNRSFRTVAGRLHGITFCSGRSTRELGRGISPVTDLLQLQEFSGMEHEERARAPVTVRLTEALYRRPLWITIGGTDHRVTTVRAIEFTERIIETGETHGIIAPIEMRTVPANSLSTPDGGYVRAAQWFLKYWTGGSSTSSSVLPFVKHPSTLKQEQSSLWATNPPPTKQLGLSHALLVCPSTDFLSYDWLRKSMQVKAAIPMDIIHHVGSTGAFYFFNSS